MKERTYANKVKANRNSPRKAKRLVLKMRVHVCCVTKLGGFNHGLHDTDLTYLARTHSYVRNKPIFQTTSTLQTPR